MTKCLQCNRRLRRERYALTFHHPTYARFIDVQVCAECFDTLEATVETSKRRMTIDSFIYDDITAMTRSR